MSYPMEKNLVPLANKMIEDLNRKILSSGKITNGKQGLKRVCWNSVYDYGITLWIGGHIKRKNGRYYLIPSWKGMPYPYSRGLDMRNTL